MIYVIILASLAILSKRANDGSACFWCVLAICYTMRPIYRKITGLTWSGRKVKHRHVSLLWLPQLTIDLMYFMVFVSRHVVPFKIVP